MSQLLQTAISNPNIYPFVKEEVHFGFDITPIINMHLQKAASLVATRNAALETLITAHESAPDQLEILIALYKFYFYQGETEKAEELVFQTLIKASMQGGFSHDWKTLSVESSDWSVIRGPARIFLYSLKALAFIRLRQRDFRDSGSILDVLNKLDPEDQVGADVIRSLLIAMKDDLEEAKD